MKSYDRMVPSQREKSAFWNIPLNVYANEEELLQGLSQQEEPACTCLFKHFARQLYTVAWRLTRNQEEAEEIVQESFLQACSHMAEFEQRSSLQTWLYRIVTNTALMHLRRQQPGVSSLEESQEKLGIDVASQELTPDGRVLDQELRKALSLAIEQLSETLRTPLLLRSVEGQTTKDAARHLGISEGTFKVRLHRARQELRKLMHGYLQEGVPLPVQGREK